MRVGSMFAGIGGICCGFKQAGAEIVWANENDYYACKTYRRNFGKDYLVEGDIRLIDLSTIPDIDILTAGFPCQPFSVMGKQKGFADPRGTLFYQILRVIDTKRPLVIFLENVENLINHDNGRTFQIIRNTLSDRGYTVKHEVLSPHTHANIPQYRNRIFIVGFYDSKCAEQFMFPKVIKLTKKINDVIDRNYVAKDFLYYTPESHYYNDLDKHMTNYNAIYRIDDSGIATKAWEIAPTLKANMGTYPDRVPIIRDYRGIRKLTPADCLALQGFPRGFRFPNMPINEAYKQLGNTVCVPVVERIAREINVCVTACEIQTQGAVLKNVQQVNSYETVANVEIDNTQISLTKVFTEEVRDILADDDDELYFAYKLNLTSKDIEEKLKTFCYTGEGKIKDYDVEKAKLPGWALVFYEYVYNNSNIPTDIEFVNNYMRRYFQSSVNNKRLIVEIDGEEKSYLREGVEARLFRTYPSLVRDLHFCLLIKELGYFDNVNYSVKNDYKDAIDILVTHRGLIYPLQLSLDSPRSNNFEEKKIARHENISDRIIRFKIDLKNPSRKAGNICLFGEKELEILRTNTEETYEI